MNDQLRKYSESVLLILMTMFLSVSAFAQDGGLDIEITIGEEEWYKQPWAWIIGGAIFVLILIAILRKKK